MSTLLHPWGGLGPCQLLIPSAVLLQCDEWLLQGLSQPFNVLCMWELFPLMLFISIFKAEALVTWGAAAEVWCGEDLSASVCAVFLGSHFPAVPMG